MGRPAPSERDTATRIATASFTAVDQATAPVELNGPFLIVATGGVGNVAVELSVDGGTTWLNLQSASGVNNSWAVPVATIIQNPNVENGVLWRLRCSAFTSGPIAARISSGGN